MEKNGASRLLQMQARFQQKQMQEREMKIASLYEAQQARALDRVRQSPSSNGGSTVSSPPQPPPVPHHPGKVRQMFEERRTKGIDKSYPLQPIHNTERAAARKPLPNGYAKVTTSSSRVTVEKKTMKAHTTVSSHSVKKQLHNKIEKIVNGSGDLNHNHEPDLNSNVKPELPQSNGEVFRPPSEDLVDSVDSAGNNSMLENETFPEELAPAPTPRSPAPAPLPAPAPAPPEEKKPARRSPAARNSPATRISPAKTKPQAATSPPRRVISENAVTENNRARGAMQRGATPVPRRQPVIGSSTSTGSGSGGKARSTAGGGGGGPSASSLGGPAAAAASGAAGEACAICGRHFAADRIAKHTDICKKSHTKKRKPFDALKHRLAGTEAEPFINKLRKHTGTPSVTKLKKPMNSNWRQKHEEFIQAIRAAKQVQAHLSAGGKLSDLPPPPPSENPDYVQCPHCNRRFNQGAADRHIPKCATYQFNKPKPAAKKR